MIRIYKNRMNLLLPKNVRGEDGAKTFHQGDITEISHVYQFHHRRIYERQGFLSLFCCPLFLHGEEPKRSVTLDPQL